MPMKMSPSVNRVGNKSEVNQEERIKWAVVWQECPIPRRLRGILCARFAF